MTRARRIGAIALATATLSTALGIAPSAAEESPPLPTITETRTPEGFVHPGIGVTADQLTNARTQVENGVEPWASYFEAMTQTKYAARDFVGRNQGVSDDRPDDDAYDDVGMRGRALEDGLGALTQALMYTFTGDDVYRENALHTLRTWSSMDPDKYEYFNDAHIHTGVPLTYFVTAAEIVRSTTPENDTRDGYDLRWTDRDQQRAEENMVRPTLDTFLYSQNRLWNQHTYGVIGMLSGAIFLDDEELYEERVEWFTVNASYESEHDINGGDVNGGLTSLIREIEADDPLNPYGESFVELVEMGRDQAHSEGDITTLSGSARILTNQATKIDPVDGTVSDDEDAVSPYAFGDNRLLAGAEKFAQFMMGEEIPFIDPSGGASAIAQQDRGRLRDLMSDLYYQYTYVEGVDVEEEAPYLALLHEQSDGPIYRYGNELENFWNPRGSDYTDCEYWLAFPEQLADEQVSVPQPAESAEVPAEKYAHPLGEGARIIGQDDEGFARLNASYGEASVAIRRIVWGDQMALRVRTDEPGTVQLSASEDAEPLDVALPDTNGKWAMIGIDLTSASVPPSAVGDHIVFINTGSESDIDIAGVTGDVTDELAVPTFEASPSLNFVAIAGENSVRAVAVDGDGSDVHYELQSAPVGMQVDADGTLTWKARAVGRHNFVVVASTDTARAALPVTIRVVPNQRFAITEVLSSVADESVYTSASWAELANAERAARDGLGSRDFAQLLADLEAAVAALQPLSPRLDDDTLDYSHAVMSDTLTPEKLAQLVDGSNKTHWGDLRVPSVDLDFGENYRVTAERFGFLARDTFPNRAEGTNVYGSNDGQTWSLLTEHTNAGDDAQIEYVDVTDEFRGKGFRYLRLQVDEPGIPTDPAYPGIWSIADFRIDGDRIESSGE